MTDYNDRDIKFIQAMIPHHEEAVKMAASEWAVGKNDDVKKWALAIFQGQRDEIDKFRSWLKDHGIKEKKHDNNSM